MRLCVCVPVLARPHRVAPLVASLEASLQDTDVEATVAFVCSKDDAPQIAAVEAAGFEPLLCGRAYEECQYARKINVAVREVDADWYLLAADDLDFRPGWLQAALAVHDETKALFVGTNDLGNALVKRGKHSTHPLVHRDYVPLGTIDDPSVLLHESYRHNAVDVEACETAMFREQWAFARLSHVRHLHPLWVRETPRDATYTKGLRYAVVDRRLLNERRRLWGARRDPQRGVRSRSVRR